MTPPSASNAPSTVGVSIPSLPQNVTIFSPSNASSGKALLASRLFTRLSLSSSTTSSQLSTLQKDERFSNSYCLLHNNFILIFDSETENNDFQESHHDHFRAVCLALKDSDIAINVASCVYDARTAVKVGFQFDVLSDGAVLVIDLMSSDDEDAEDDDDDDSEDGAQLQMMTVDEDVKASKS